MATAFIVLLNSIVPHSIKVFIPKDYFQFLICGVRHSKCLECNFSIRNDGVVIRQFFSHPVQYVENAANGEGVDFSTEYAVEVCFN